MNSQKKNYYNTEETNMLIGVLSLQGDYDLHIKQLSRLNVKSLKVNNSEDLSKTDALIIPGGESSTISILIDKLNLRSKIADYALSKCIFGTCAGLIMISSLKDKKVNALNILSLDINRNGYGRQVDSFSKDINLKFDKKLPFTAKFIRAPIINHLSDKSIEVLASCDNIPVLVKKNNILGSSFHPEIGNDCRIHKFFIKMVNSEKV